MSWTADAHLEPPLLRLLREETLSAVRAEDLRQALEEARLHALSSLVYEVVAGEGRCLRGEDLCALRDEALSVSASTLRARVQLEKTLASLGRAGIVPLALKGPTLAARCWPHPGARPCTDIDLFVPPHQLQGAREVLGAMGLRPLSPELEVVALRSHHHLSFRGGVALVELHFRLNSGLGRGLTWEMVEPRVVDAEFAGHAVRRLCLEDELVYLTVHAAGHLFERLSWLLDLKFLLASAEPDWDDLVRTARHAGVATSVWMALSLAREGLGARVPTAVLARLAPQAAQARALVSLFPPDSLVRHPLWGHRWGLPLVRVLLVDSSMTAVRLLGQGAFRRLRRELSGRLPGWRPPRWRELF